MPLSEYEQRVLEQMERQLASDDPRLANTLTQRRRRPVMRFVLTGAGAVVGLLLLVLGAANSKPWLGAIGFVLMFASVALAFAMPRRSAGPQGVVGTDGKVHRPVRRSVSKQGFMARLEARWERRRDQGGR